MCHMEYLRKAWQKYGNKVHNPFHYPSMNGQQYHHQTHIIGRTYYCVKVEFRQISTVLVILARLECILTIPVN